MPADLPPLELVTEVSAALTDDGDVLPVLARLRSRGVPAELAAAAATQVRLRRRARDRFGPLADRLWWDDALLQQASRPQVAARHARLLRESGAQRVADLGCGLGSDTLALAAAGLSVLAVDRDPRALQLTAANAAALGLADRVTTRRADVTGLTAAELTAEGCDAVFADPARRDPAGRRLLRPEQWTPSWATVAELASAIPAGLVKVAPGIAHDLPGEGTTTIWTSVSGDLVEAAVAFGTAARPPVRRCALLLPSGATTTDRELPAGPPPVGDVGRRLLEPDDAVVRAGLVGVVVEAVGGRLLHPKVSLVTTDDPAAASPLARAYDVVDRLPAAARRLRAELRRLGFGDVVVKTRATAVTPEALRAALRLTGDGPTATLLVTRTDAGPLVLLVRPAQDSTSST